MGDTQYQSDQETSSRSTTVTPIPFTEETQEPSIPRTPEPGQINQTSPPQQQETSPTTLTEPIICLPTYAQMQEELEEGISNIEEHLENSLPTMRYQNTKTIKSIMKGLQKLTEKKYQNTEGTECCSFCVLIFFLG
jgi:hypothetical protein